MSTQTKFRLLFSALAFGWASLYGAAGWAQDEDAEADLGSDAVDELEAEGEPEVEKDPDVVGEEPLVDPEADPETNKYNPIEDPLTTYFFMGLRFRNFIVPKFMVNLFAEGGRTVNVFSAGPELSVRKDGLEFDFALTSPWADYSMDPTIFKGNKEPDINYERVESNLKIFYLTIDILKDIPLDEKGMFSFLIGGGVGVGGVFGELRRSQVYPDDPDNIQPDDPSKWQDCNGPNDPAITDPNTNNSYCDDDNENFNGYEEPSWANGGSKPFIFPYLALPHLAFRFKPVKQFQTRVDGGFSMTGFFFGLAAGYKLP